MSQFDVHANPGRNRQHIPFVVVVQSSLFGSLQRRVVVPLVAAESLARHGELPETPVTPRFTLANRQLILNPLEIVSVPCALLGEPVASLADQGDTIVAALDAVFSRAWD